jgi:hypothetical protein
MGQALPPAGSGPEVPKPDAAKTDQSPPLRPELEAVKPAEPSGPASKTERRPQLPPARAGAPQEILFTSSPGGATATLDGNPAMACTTPCTLQVPQGKHAVAIVLSGYEIERREFTVGNGPAELTPIQLQVAKGTLMLTSVPDGAAVLINGQRTKYSTPAQIPLVLGTYTVTIEKGGRQATESVEIKGSITSRRFVLGQ